MTNANDDLAIKYFKRMKTTDANSNVRQNQTSMSGGATPQES